ncbi:MAG: hypothetical protein RIA71_10600 [Oceanicaulis sp.]
MGAKQAFSIVNGVLVMVVGGVRDRADAICGYAQFREHLDRAATRRVLLDVRLATNAENPQQLVMRAREFGAATPACQVAIFARALDGEFARLYRRGLSETGHEVQVFADIKEAEAWLSAPAEADRLYLI